MNPETDCYILPGSYPPPLDAPLTAPYQNDTTVDRLIAILLTFVASLTYVLAGTILMFSIIVTAIVFSGHSSSLHFHVGMSHILWNAGIFFCLLYTAQISSPRLPSLRANSNAITPLGAAYVLSLFVLLPVFFFFSDWPIGLSFIIPWITLSFCAASLMILEREEARRPEGERILQNGQLLSDGVPVNFCVATFLILYIAVKNMITMAPGNSFDWNWNYHQESEDKPDDAAQTTSDAKPSNPDHSA